MSIHLCVLLWSRPGAEEALCAYEDTVLGLMGDHGARVLQRMRTDGAIGAPLEIQVLEFPSQSALDGYMQDEPHSSCGRSRCGDRADGRAAG
jgi:hypothetical protein